MIPAEPFVPPHPPRLPRGLPPLAMLRLARRNWLAIWAESAFTRDLMHSRIFWRQTIVCNSPALVQEAFVTRHEILQRTSPQHRHALRPLLGDGLFVSDGALWKERRRVVAPVTHASRLAELVPAITEAAAERRVAHGHVELGGRSSRAAAEREPEPGEACDRTAVDQELAARRDHSVRRRVARVEEGFAARALRRAQRTAARNECRVARGPERDERGRQRARARERQRAAREQHLVRDGVQVRPNL